jgi:DNA-binding NarL/FixJ family response regulator
MWRHTPLSDHDWVVGEKSKSVWVDIRTTQRIVAIGLRTAIESANGPLEVTFERPDSSGQPDIVLYDVINLDDGNDTDLDHLLAHTVSTVIAVDRTLKPELGTRAKEKGVEWAIDLGITPEDLLEVIAAAVAGNLDETDAAQEWDTKEYLGSADGLSPRESHVLQLIAQGYGNQEIADTLFLSINSIKTYIRAAYRKIGVESRTQAVVWAIQHGFLPERDETDEAPVGWAYHPPARWSGNRPFG